jgi:hypothetical protein
MVAAGTIRGAETSFDAALTLSGKPTATGDVVIYPKYQVLAADDAAFSRLTDAQRTALRDAAVAARDLAIADHTSDLERSQAWCNFGGRVVLAGAANVATFQAAAAPLVAKLAEAPITATALEAIRSLKERTAGTRVDACEPVATVDAPWPSIAPGPTQTLLPDGVYIHIADRSALIAAGATGVDIENAGKWTLTVAGEQAQWVFDHDQGNPRETYPIRFELMGDRVRFQFANSAEYFDMRWQIDGDVLSMDLVASNSPIGGRSNTSLAYRVLNVILAGEYTKVE